MKALRQNISKYMAIFGILLFPCLAHSACGEKEITRPEVKEPLMPEKDDSQMQIIDKTTITTTTAFNSGTEGFNSFRIPSIVTAKDGSLLVAGEGRYTTWVDKSRTDIVLKRSTDGGKTWSSLMNMTSTINTGNAFAFMDPLLIVDNTSGRIWMFCVRWVISAANASQNRAFMRTSSDNGATWSEPTDVTGVVTAEGGNISGFGPGSGFQITEGRYKGRLIVPTRQTAGTSTVCQTLYSDNAGLEWKLGVGIKPAGESQMAYCGNDILTLNVRSGGGRRAGFSTDGGVTWTAPSTTDAPDLPGTAGGCQASVWGVGANNVLFCGIQGGVANSAHDDRCKLAIYRSEDGARSWKRSELLYEKAAGYCCITTMNDGKIAIVFEAGDGEGFPKLTNRPEGWMRLDVMILPKEVVDPNYWFEK